MTDVSPKAAASSQALGVSDLAADFGPIYVGVNAGVEDATPADVDVAEWEEVLEDTLLDALALHKSDPAYFAGIPPRPWARTAALFRFSSRRRRDRRRARRDEKYVQDFLPRYFDLDVLSDLIRRERSRAIARAWQVLTPRTRLVIEAVDLRGLSRREAADTLGLSERIVKRELDEGRPLLAVLLSDWNTRRTRARTRGARGRTAGSLTTQHGDL